MMGRFINGSLVGLGIGILFAPMRGEEMRRLIKERFATWQQRLPNNQTHFAQPGSSRTDQLSDLAEPRRKNTMPIAGSVADMTGQPSAPAEPTSPKWQADSPSFRP